MECVNLMEEGMLSKEIGWECASVEILRAWIAPCRRDEPRISVIAQWASGWKTACLANRSRCTLAAAGSQPGILQCRTLPCNLLVDLVSHRGAFLLDFCPHKKSDLECLVFNCSFLALLAFWTLTCTLSVFILLLSSWLSLYRLGPHRKIPSGIEPHQCVNNMWLRWPLSCGTPVSQQLCLAQAAEIPQGGRAYLSGIWSLLPN